MSATGQPDLVLVEFKFDEIFSGATHYAKLYTSDYVLDESITACKRRTRSNKYAFDLGESVIRSRSIVLLRLDETAFAEAWELFRERTEVALSLLRDMGLLVSTHTTAKTSNHLVFHVIGPV